MPVDVVDRLLDPAERKLIVRLAREMAPKTRKVHVRPLKRFGFSTAKLYLVHFDEQRAGRPYVVKIDRKSKFEEEHSALEDLKVFFADADVRSRAVGELGAIAYPLHESSPGDIITFEDLLTRPRSTDTQLERALDSVYHRCCGQAHEAASRRAQRLSTVYKWDHQGIATPAELAKALGGEYSDKPFSFYDAEIVDPRAVRARLAKSRPRILIGPIHGDLHGSNIVFDQESRPHLIDFAWGDHQGHVMKDFVLMENSLRFFAFPRYFDASLQNAVDHALLGEYGTTDVRELVKGKPLEADYMRLMRLLDVIRVRAREVAGDAFFDEYLQAQFMILFRLLQYPTYPFHATLRALGTLGRRVYDAL